MKLTNKITPSINFPVALIRNKETDKENTNENKADATNSSFKKYSYKNIYTSISSFFPKTLKLDINKIERNSNPDQTDRQIPPEMVDIILAYVTKPYIPIESAQKLFLLMRINRTFLNRVKIILKNENVNSSWNKDKDCIQQIERSLRWNSYIKYLSKAQQREWCKRNVDAIAKNNTLHANQIAYQVRRIPDVAQHIKLDFDNITAKESNTILCSLSKRTDLKSLDLYIGYESIPIGQKFTEALIKILNKNTALVDIPKLIFRKNTFDVSKLDAFMQALSQKKVGALSFNEIKMNEENIKKCSEYLKKLDIRFLSIDCAALSHEGMKYLILNLPKNLKSLSLKNNNIDTNIAKFIFENPKDTKVKHIDLSHNRLRDFQVNDLRKIAEHLSIEKIKLYYYGLHNEKSYFTGIQNKYKNEIQIFFEFTPL